MMNINILNQRKKSTQTAFWLLGIFICILTIGLAIAQEKWSYFLLISLPLFIYLSIEKPFIFPFGLYAILLPFDSISSLTGSSHVTTLTKVLGILSIMAFSVKGLFEGKFRKPDVTIMSLVLFIMFGLLSVVWAISPEIAIAHFQTAIGLLILYVICSSYMITEKEFNILKTFVLIGGIFAGILLVFNFATGHNYYSSTRTTIEYGGMLANPNSWSISLLMPVSICVGMIITRESKTEKALFILIFLVMLFGLIATGSRKTLLGVGTILIVYNIFSKKKITSGIIVAAAVFVVLSCAPDYIIARFGNAFQDRGSGRLDIWYVGWKALENYWLCGAGLSNFPLAYNQYSIYAPHYEGFTRGPHNTYLSILVELGIVGGTLMFFALKLHYQKIKSRFAEYGMDEIMLKATFWGMIITSFFSTNLWDKSFWFLFMMIMMHKNVYESRPILT
jgi:O-antigen ligase